MTACKKCGSTNIKWWTANGLCLECGSTLYSDGSVVQTAAQSGYWPDAMFEAMVDGLRGTADVPGGDGFGGWSRRK